MKCKCGNASKLGEPTDKCWCCHYLERFDKEFIKEHLKPVDEEINGLDSVPVRDTGGVHGREQE